VKKDYTTSFEWFVKVVEENLNPENTHVCVLNEEYDQGVDSSIIYSLEPESFIYGEAHFYLGTIFKNCQGSTKDKEKAVEHFELAVSYGSKKAQSFIKKRARFLNKIKEFYHH
jgi:TPR repeat protein